MRPLVRKRDKRFQNGVTKNAGWQDEFVMHRRQIPWMSNLKNLIHVLDISSCSKDLAYCLCTAGDIEFGWWEFKLIKRFGKAVKLLRKHQKKYFIQSRIRKMKGTCKSFRKYSRTCLNRTTYKLKRDNWHFCWIR